MIFTVKEKIELTILLISNGPAFRKELLGWTWWHIGFLHIDVNMAVLEVEGEIVVVVYVLVVLVHVNEASPIHLNHLLLFVSFVSCHATC